MSSAPDARVDRSLRRLLRRPEVAAVVADEARRLGPGHWITDPAGEVLLGEPGAAAGPGRPVQVDGRQVGAVHGSAPEALARLLELLATQDSETRALGQESLDRYKELTLLYALSSKIIAAPDAAAITALVCEEAMRLLRCSGAAALLLNADTGLLELVATQGQALHERATREVGSDIVAEVLERGVGEIVNEVGADGRGLNTTQALRAVVCSPLASNGRVFGVLLAGSVAAREFSAADLQVMNAMAAQAAAAIEVARLNRDLKTTERKPVSLIYGVDDRPPAGTLLLLGLQHVLIALMSLTVPVLVALEAAATRATTSAVVSMSLLAMALGTLLQRSRHALAGSGYLAPLVTSAIFLGPSLLAVHRGGLPLVFGMTVFAGLAMIALSQLMRRFRKMFPPEISGIVVLMVGLSLVPIGLPRFLGMDAADPVSRPSEWGVGLLTLGIIIALSVRTAGRLRLYATAVGIAVGYLAAVALGAFDASVFDTMRELPMFGADGLVWHGLAFDPALAVPFLAAALACGAKDAGLVISCQKTDDALWKRPEMRSLSGGVVASGLGNVAAGLLGGTGLSISASNVGLAAAGGATSRRVAEVIAAIFVLLALTPKLNALLALIPPPVMGAGLLYVACHLVVLGAELITLRMLDARRGYVIGLPLVVGVGLMAAPDIAGGAPAWVQAVIASPLAVATIAALLLNLLLNAGVSNRAHCELPIDAAVGEALRSFFERQGASWGARGDVIRRAAPAVTEWYEDLRQITGVTQAAVDLQFDEFNLVAVVRWGQGRGDAAPGGAEALRAALDSVARAIARRYGCSARLQPGPSASFVFEH